MSFLEKFLLKEGTSLARSILQSNAKKGIRNVFFRFKSKSKDQIKKELIETIGYDTSHYYLGKNQDIGFKPSPIFIREWLTNCPYVANKIIKDEETGIVYLNNNPITPSNRIKIINEFIRQTNIKSTVLNSNFNNAFNMLDLTDVTGISFKNNFDGWNENKDSVIDNFMTNLYGDSLETNSNYASFLFKKWIVGTAKRVMTPGSPFDGCLVLTGPGGVGKTSFFRDILPEPFSNRTGEILCNIKNSQRLMESIIGKTIVCFDELSGLNSPKVQETFKQLLSSRFIDVRLAWQRSVQRFNLRNSFCATTNKEKFIKDSAMSRRLWTIELNDKSRINFDYFNSVKNNLWKEAVYLANTDESYMLSIEEQKIVEENNRKYMV